MRKKSYMKASSSYSSYYGKREKSARKAVTLIFAFVALFAITAVLIMFVHFGDVRSKKNDAINRLSSVKDEVTSLSKQKKSLESELSNLQSELDNLRIEYDSLEE